MIESESLLRQQFLSGGEALLKLGRFEKKDCRSEKSY